MPELSGSYQAYIGFETRSSGSLMHHHTTDASNCNLNQNTTKATRT